jgi:hypothetical protein
MNDVTQILVGGVGQILAAVAMLAPLLLVLIRKDKLKRFLTRFAGKDWQLRSMFIIGVSMGNGVLRIDDGFMNAVVAGIIPGCLMLFIYLLKDIFFNRWYEVTYVGRYRLVRIK